MALTRKRDRFRRLKEKLRDSKGTPSPGSEAEGYMKFITGQSTYKIENKLLSGAKRRGLVGVLPFNLPEANTILYAAQLTWNANKKRQELTITDANLGYSKWTGDAKTQKNDSGFFPALLQVYKRDAALDNPTKKSEITNKNYNRIGTRGFNLPFGRTATLDEAGRVTELKASLNANADIVGVSYTPEEWQATASLGAIEDVPAPAAPAP